MGEHIDDEGRFQSDKYSEWSPPDFFPLKLTDVMAWQPLWDYAFTRYDEDPELSEDLWDRLIAVGFRALMCNKKISEDQRLSYCGNGPIHVGKHYSERTGVTHA